MIASRHFFTRTVASAATGYLAFLLGGEANENEKNSFDFVIGIDVSEAKLDIAWGGKGPVETIVNDAPFIKTFSREKQVRERAHRSGGSPSPSSPVSKIATLR